MAYFEFKPTETLYHYTSSAGFRGIVGSKRLWLSDVRSSNDPREVIFGLGRIRPIVNQILKDLDESTPSVSLRALLENVFTAIKSTSYYFCCFTPFGDQLPMWHSYSSSGDGVAIGFRPRALSGLHGRFNKVEYFGETDTDSERDDYLREVVREILERAISYRAELTVEQKIAFSSEIISRCTSIKHASWEYEREIRCVYSQSNTPSTINGRIVPTSLMLDGSEVGPFEEKFRETSFGRVPYHDFCFGKAHGKEFDASGSIARVVVGPKSTLSVPDVKAILNSEGFVNFEVCQSECSWR